MGGMTPTPQPPLNPVKPQTIPKPMVIPDSNPAAGGSVKTRKGIAMKTVRIIALL